tara:strand:+ start:269 stop:433 length:165 start_codon:yes stop_codon:yes gene_type:complete
MRFVYFALLVMGCSDSLKVKVDTSEVPYDDITLVTTTNVDDTGCDSGEICDTAG